MTCTSKVPDKYAPDIKVQHSRQGDYLVTITTEVRPAIIDFQDILAACQVEEDPDCGPPWEEDDGWAHETVPEYQLNTEARWSHSVREIVHKDGNTSDRLEWIGHYNEDDVVRLGPGDRRLILVSFDQAREWLGGPRRGEHKQVYWERLATFRRRNLEQLKKWYRDGWHHYVVTCTFLGHSDSLGGIQTKDDSPCDPYLDECKEDVAQDVAVKLTKVGYTIVNLPDYTEQHAKRTVKQVYLRQRLAYQLGFDDVDKYRQWLGHGGRME